MGGPGPEQPGFFEGVALGLTEGLVLTDSDGLILWVSPRTGELVGLPVADVVGRTLTSFQHPDDVALSRARHAERDMQPIDARPPSAHSVRRVQQADGSYRWLDVTSTDLTDDPRVGAVVVVLRETVESHMRWETERRLRALVENAQDALLVYGPDLEVVYASPAVAELLDDISGTLLDLIDRALPQEQHAGAMAAYGEMLEVSGSRVERLLRLRRTDGVEHWVQVRATNMLDDPAVCGIVLNGRDVTEQVELEEHLRNAARHDALTGLPNRAEILDLLTDALRDANEPERIGVLFLDLDRFKVVNDSFGHVIGDRVLAELGARLRDAVGDRGTVGRFGGDEYVVIAPIDGRDDAIDIADLLARIASAPFVVEAPDHERAEVYLSGSVGIALSAVNSDSATMLHHADAAMYRAKERGRGSWELYDEGMRRAAISRLTLEADMARALDDRGFELWYQPIVDLVSRRPLSVEALARWRHRDGTLISPVDFIPVAEETGGIHRLGAWALATACGQVRAWQRQGIDMRVAVNLSPRQLSRPELAADIDDLLRSSDLAPDCLTLEITESLLMDDPDLAVKALSMLRDIGVRLALDDFGTGWSSLTYLRTVPVDVVKIDRSFVQGIVESPDDRAIVGAVISMCRALGKRVVAEGVETESQLAALRGLGCTHAQGYLFAKPMPGPEVATWLDRYREAGNRDPNLVP